MSDLSSAIQPKVDQLTSDDLIPGPLTIRITGVSVVKTPEQPVSIAYAGDEGRPWKPCKSMTRVLVHLWGADSSTFVDRSITLYRDPNVLWGDMKVGGIRISHMSHITGNQTLALTATRGNKKPFTVKPLAVLPANPPTPQPGTSAPPATPRKSVRDIVRERIIAAQNADDLVAITRLPDYMNAMQKAPDGIKAELQKMLNDAHREFPTASEEPINHAPPPAEDDGWPGPETAIPDWASA